MHPKILQARDGNPSGEVRTYVNDLIDAARRRESPEDLRRKIARLVPEYQYPGAADFDGRRTKPHPASHPAVVAETQVAANFQLNNSLSA
jgi:hypothetical protein